MPDDPFPHSRYLVVRLFSIVLITLLVSSCKNDIQQILAFENMHELPAQSALEIEIMYSDSAMVKMKIQAPVLNRFTNTDEPYMDFPKGLRVEFYTQQGSIETELTANYGQFFEAKEIWEVSNDVIVINREGTIINSEFLTWDMKKEKIYSDKYVKITSKDEIIMGDGFESDQNFVDYTIFNTTGSFSLNEED